MRTFRSIMLGGGSAALAVLLAIEPALAADCQEVRSTFSPGDWVGEASLVGNLHEDEYGQVAADAEASFRLTVARDGQATGAIALSGQAELESDVLDVYTIASWALEAELGGFTGEISAEGEQVWEFEGLHGIGRQYYDSQTGLTRTKTIKLEPLEANCSMAYGHFGSGFTSSSDDVLTWVAYRTGGSQDPAIEDLLLEIVDRANAALAAGEESLPYAIGQLVVELIKLNSMLSAPDYCAEVPGGLKPGSPGAAYAHRLLHDVLTHMLLEAQDGAYETSSVIEMMTHGLTAAGLDPSRCGADPDQIYAERQELMELFRVVLDHRLAEARADGDTAQTRMILLAAYQFGLTLEDYSS